MFLVGFTREPITKKFGLLTVNEKVEKGYFIAAVTDNYLSYYVSEGDGFSVIESPLPIDSYKDDLLYTKITYRFEDFKVTVNKTSISGRPLYYHCNSKGEIYFSSHISLLRDAGIQIEENKEALPEFFVYRMVMPPRTLFREIKQVISGTVVTFKLINDKFVAISSSSYQPRKLNFSQHITTIEQHAEVMTSYIREAFRKLGPLEQRLCALLSGGIDSSIAVRILQDEYAIDHSYATCFPFEEDRLNREKRYAISGAQDLKIEQNLFETSVQDYLSGFIDSIYLAEEPLHHLQSVCLHLLFSKGIPSHEDVVVVAAGMGAAFGNFRNYLYMKGKPEFELLLPLLKSSGLLRAIHALTGRGMGISRAITELKSDLPLSDVNNPIWAWHAHGSTEWVRRYFRVTDEEIIANQYQTIQQYKADSVFDVWALYSLLGDEQITTQIWAKLGEGNDRILFFPNYLTELLDHAFSLPWNLKLGRPENILRKGMARAVNVPEKVLKRPKSGFGVISKSWSREGGVFEPLVPLTAGIIETSQIRELQSEDPKKAQTFWNILNYAIWKRAIIDNEPADVLQEELMRSINDSPPV